MSAITIHNLAKSHGARQLFCDASIQFQMGQRYGIVGANGSGKSTLIKIIAGDEEASSGTVTIPKKMRVGVLRQDHFRYEHERILDVVMMGNPELWAAMKEKEEVLARAHEHFDADRYTELEDVVLRFDGYTMESRASEILEGLNIPTRVHEQPLSSLSGGYKLRVLLAQALASNPDILLLDEPTNHLDIISIKWLEDFLEAFLGCVLVISHDRRFLDRISTHTVDVDYERVMLYPGNYSQFEELKALDRELKEAEIQKREDQIADIKAFVDRFKAKASKARQANSKAKQMERIVIEELPKSSRRYPRFKFEPARPSGKDVSIVKNLTVAYNEVPVLNDVSVTVHRDDRIAIIGPNGIGKSTLLKVLVGELEPHEGTTEWGYEARPGYFSQDHHELGPHQEQSIQDYLWQFCPERSLGFVRQVLATMLFTQDEAEKPIKSLSGGECARLVFGMLSILQPNVLVLDEPTNHLDLEGIEALAEGLKGYQGTIIFVSHDRWFVSQLATRVFEIRPDGVEDFLGNYEEYLYYTERKDHLKRPGA